MSCYQIASNVKFLSGINEFYYISDTVKQVEVERNETLLELSSKKIDCVEVHSSFAFSPGSDDGKNETHQANENQDLQGIETVLGENKNANKPLHDGIPQVSHANDDAEKAGASPVTTRDSVGSITKIPRDKKMLRSASDCAKETESAIKATEAKEINRAAGGPNYSSEKESPAENNQLQFVPGKAQRQDDPEGDWTQNLKNRKSRVTSRENKKQMRVAISKEHETDGMIELFGNCFAKVEGYTTTCGRFFIILHN